MITLKLEVTLVLNADMVDESIFKDAILEYAQDTMVDAEQGESVVVEVIHAP